MNDRSRTYRFLADENFPGPSIRLLREAGHDVLAVAEDAARIPDEDVLAWARQERRILLTFDRDYGELIFYRHRPAPLGVVFFRMNPVPPEEPIARLFALLDSPTLEVEAMFTVLGGDPPRQHALPSAEGQT